MVSKKMELNFELPKSITTSVPCNPILTEHSPVRCMAENPPILMLDISNIPSIVWLNNCVISSRINKTERYVN